MRTLATRAMLVVVCIGMMSVLLAACGRAPAATPTASTAGSSSDAWQPRQLTTTVSGSGASFPNALYQVWISVYTKNIAPGVTLSYQSVGSGQGKKDFVAGLTDFGGTDSALSAEEVNAQAPDAIHILNRLPTVPVHII